MKFDLMLRLRTKSVCPCGFDLMKAEVGKVYRAASESVGKGTLKCGGCKKEMLVTLIAVDEGALEVRYLVLEVMDLMTD